MAYTVGSMNTAIYHSLQLRGWPMRGGGNTKIKNFFLQTLMKPLHMFVLDDLYSNVC